MAQGSTAFIAAQEEREYSNSLLDRVEAGLMATMNTPEKAQFSRRESNGYEKSPKWNVRSFKGEQNTERMSGVGAGNTASKATPEKKKKRKKRSSGVIEGAFSEDFPATIEADTLEFPMLGLETEEMDTKFPEASGSKKAKKHKKKKRKSENLGLQDHVGTQVVEPEPPVGGHDAGEEKARKKEAKRLRKESIRVAAQKAQEFGRIPIEDEDDGLSGMEEIALETPTKKRRRDRRPSLEDLEVSYLTHEASVDLDAREQLKSTPKQKKRKLDKLLDRTPLQLNSLPNESSSDPFWIGTAKEESQQQQAAEKSVGKSTRKNKKKRRLDQHAVESPTQLHTVDFHEPPSSSKHTQSGQDLDNLNDAPKKKKKEEAKASKENVTVLKGPRSHSSSSTPVSEEESSSASNLPPPDDSSSSEDEKKGISARTLRPESVIRPGKSQINRLSNDPAPIRPKEVVMKKETPIPPPRPRNPVVRDIPIRKETPIPPPKRLIQTATRTPVAVTKLVRPKKLVAKSGAESDDESVKAEEQSLSQMIASLKKSNTKIHDTFSDDDDGSSEEEDAVESIKKATAKLGSLFSVDANNTSTGKDKKDEKVGSSAKSGHARNILTNIVHPLMSNQDGANTASEDWESTVGKVRSTARGDDDTEVQENIAFSSTYITSRPAGIKISNVTFNKHDLRHNEGWVVSPASYPGESDGNDFKLKLCTVISGRVNVRLGNDAFGVGKGSVFRVRGGEDCVARNEEKKVAVVWVVCVE